MLNPNAKIFRPNTEYNNSGPRACISDPVRADVAIKTSIKAASGGSGKPALIRSYEPSNNRFLSGPPPNAPTGPRAMIELRNNNRKNTKNRTNKNTKKNSNKPRKNNITNQYPSRFPRSSRPRLDSVATTILCASPPAAALIFPFPPAPPSISEEESSPSVSADDYTEDFEDAFDVDVNQMVDLACLEMQFDSYVEEVEKKSGRWVESVLSKALEVPVLTSDEERAIHFGDMALNGCIFEKRIPTSPAFRTVSAIGKTCGSNVESERSWMMGGILGC